MVERPRILIATQLLGRNGGVGVYVIRLATALREAGHEVRIVASSLAEKDAEAIVIPGLAAHSVDDDVRAALAHEVIAFGPDVVHVHHLFDPLLVGLFREHAPVVWGVHDYMLCPTGNLYFQPGDECRRPHGPGCIPHILFHGCAHTKDPRTLPRGYRESATNLAILRGVDVALAFSRFVVANLQRNHLPSIELAPYISSEARPGGPPPPAGLPRVLFVGRLSASKGLQVLIEAIAGIEAELEVCGDGWFMPDACRAVRRHGIEDRVTFHGWLDPEPLSAAYRRASVVAVPSLWPEPFGIIGIEAMAHERPVVASDTGGISEWLDHGRTGILVPPGNASRLAAALSGVLADPARAYAMGQAGLRLVLRDFSAAAHLAALEQVHAAALRRWPGPHASTVEAVSG